MFTMPTGGFLVLGVVLAFLAYRTNKKQEILAFKEKEAKKAQLENKEEAK